MKIEYKKFITRDYIRSSQDKIFLFGDNDMRKGSGGQAFEMRGEPNSFGIRVKKAPLTGDEVYYTDKEYSNNIKKIEEDIQKAILFAKKFNKVIVIPTDGIGTGFAKLNEKAPRTLDYLKRRLNELKEE